MSTFTNFNPAQDGPRKCDCCSDELKPDEPVLVSNDRIKFMCHSCVTACRKLLIEDLENA